MTTDVEKLAKWGLNLRQILLRFVHLSRWFANQLTASRQRLAEFYHRRDLVEAFVSVITEQSSHITNQLEKDKIQRVGMGLAKMLTEALIEHRDLIQHFTLIFRQFRSKQSLVLFVHLSRWLANQPEEFRQRMLELYDRGDLANAFVSFLRGWGSDFTLGYAQNQSRIRELYLAELFPEARDMRIPVAVVHEESHHPNKVDMVYVCAIAAAKRAKNIFEFGTYRGQTTCGLASIADDVIVWTFNLPAEADQRYMKYIGQCIKNSPYKERIRQLFGDSRTFDTASFTQKMDFIFIDADHSYEAVKNDTEKALRMLRRGGIIVWHDYAAKSPGVYRFVQEFSQSFPVFRIRNTCLVVYIDGVDAEKYISAPMERSLESEETTRFFVEQFP
ncbi:MAG: class I SAM-dependent methyltransferase [Chromatiales bacterium]